MIPRALLVAIVVCLFVVFGARALGNAVGHEVQNRVIVTRNGQTDDCRREVRNSDGVVYWIDCHPVVYP